MSSPDPAVTAIRSAVRAATADLEPGDLVLVACSGGRDSLALAAGTAFVAPRAGLRAGAVVVDHGWRPSSPEVAAAAAAACRGLGLDPVEVVRVSPAGHGGPEAAARDARYAALEEVADRLEARAVMLGHTRDDQAETVLLGLARGSGARSLAGMAARRGRLRRPLLQVSRSVTARACVAADLAHWDDPANADPAFTRVRVRQAMPALEAAVGPGLAEALARSAEQLREDADALDALAAAVLAEADAAGAGQRAGRRPDGSRLVGGLDTEVLGAAPDALRRRALLAAARRAGSPAGALMRRHILAIDALVVGWHGQGPVHLPGGVVARRSCGRLMFDRPSPSESADLTQE